VYSRTRTDGINPLSVNQVIHNPKRKHHTLSYDYESNKRKRISHSRAYTNNNSGFEDVQKFCGSFNPYGNGQTESFFLPYINPRHLDDCARLLDNHQALYRFVQNRDGKGYHTLVRATPSTDMARLYEILTQTGSAVRPPRHEPKSKDRVITKRTIECKDPERAAEKKQIFGNSNCARKDKRPSKKDLVKRALCIEQQRENSKLETAQYHIEEARELSRPYEEGEYIRFESHKPETPHIPPVPPSPVTPVPDTPAPPPSVPSTASTETEPDETPSLPTKLIDFAYNQPTQLSFLTRVQLVMGPLILLFAVLSAVPDALYLHAALFCYFTAALSITISISFRWNKRIRIRSTTTTPPESATEDARLDVHAGTKLLHSDAKLHYVEVSTFIHPTILSFRMPFLTSYKAKEILISQELYLQLYSVMNSVPLTASKNDILSRLHRSAGSITSINIDRSLICSGVNVHSNTLIVAYHFAIKTQLDMAHPDFHLPLADLQCAPTSTDTVTAKSFCPTFFRLRPAPKHVALGTAILLSVALSIFLAYSLGLDTRPLSRIFQMSVPLLQALKNALLMVLPREIKLFVRLLESSCVHIFAQIFSP